MRHQNDCPPHESLSREPAELLPPTKNGFSVILSCVEAAYERQVPYCETRNRLRLPNRMQMRALFEQRTATQQS